MWVTLRPSMACVIGLRSHTFTHPPLLRRPCVTRQTPFKASFYGSQVSGHNGGLRSIVCKEVFRQSKAFLAIGCSVSGRILESRGPVPCQPGSESSLCCTRQTATGSNYSVREEARGAEMSSLSPQTDNSEKRMFYLRRSDPTQYIPSHRRICRGHRPPPQAPPPPSNHSIIFISSCIRAQPLICYRSPQVS